MATVTLDAGVMLNLLRSLQPTREQVPAVLALVSRTRAAYPTGSYEERVAMELEGTILAGLSAREKGEMTRQALVLAGRLRAG